MINTKANSLYEAEKNSEEAPQNLEEALEQIASLKEQLYCYKTVANHTSNGVIVLDLNGVVMWVNDSFSKLSGRSLDEVVGKTANQFLAGTTANLASAHMVWTMMQLRQGFTSEMNHVNKSGDPYQIIVNGEPISDEEGNVFGFAMIETDITLLKIMEAALSDAHRAAEEKEAAKTNFFANLSHELRTPLNGILGLAQLLEATKLSEEQAEYVRSICESGESLLTLIGNLLALTTSASDRVNSDFEEVDITRKLNFLSGRFSSDCAKKGVLFSVSIEETVPTKIWLPWTNVSKVLYHLLDNAVKFTQSGNIKLNVSVGSDSQIRFRVQDTGVGIPADALPQIFNEFFQADESSTRNYQGIGLGLPLAKKFAASFGSEVYVQTVEGRGSIFAFEAPYHSV